MPKYLKRDAATGRTIEEAGLATSAGVSSAGLFPQLDANGKLDTSFMPSGIGAETQSVIASEALAAGEAVNFWSNAGVINARKADGSTVGKPADGYVKAAFASAATAIVFTDGLNDQLTGLTPGARIYLSGATAGAVTSTVVTGAGKTHQYLGKAISATSLQFEPHEPIDLVA
jgi:hypothetical protein